MTKKPGALASALRKSGATVDGVRNDEPATVSQTKPAGSPKLPVRGRQQSRYMHRGQFDAS
jgi:hypothetical protein